jgi:hypothetical protein
LCGIDIELRYEFTAFCKFDDLAWMCRICIDGIAVDRKQVSIRCEYERQWSPRVRNREDDRAFRG